MKDIRFGEGNIATDSVLKPMLEVLGKKTSRGIKKAGKFMQDLYVAEDDIWKIINYETQLITRGDRYRKAGIKISDDALKLLARASEGSVRDAVSLLDRALIFQTLDQNKTIQETDVRKMLGIADKSKIINLISCIFDGNEKGAIEQLKELSDGGLDAKNFLNDFLELLYLFGRRANLGPIEKDLFLSEGEIKLIDKISKDLNMQDLGLFWQLSLKTIDDLKLVSNEDVALKMFVMQLIHIKNFEKNTEKTVSVDKQNEVSDLKARENMETTEETKPVNFVKEQMKNTDQIKSRRNEQHSKMNNQSTWPSKSSYI